jgi:hypothetical protein
VSYHGTICRSQIALEQCGDDIQVFLGAPLNAVGNPEIAVAKNGEAQTRDRLLNRAIPGQAED